MPWLDGGQPAMMAALDHGPAHLPTGLFTGSPERVLAGMKVHANTISHARLVALEETYPRTREAIGPDRFNAHSRLFLQQPGVTGQPHAAIGAGFDAFLSAQEERAGAADLARFEWLWLAAYNAADAEPLALAALAGLAPDAVLAFVLARHPAAFASPFSAPFAPLVHDSIGAEVPGLAIAAAILITRPDAEVLVAPASAAMARVLAEAQTPLTIGNLLTRLAEEEEDEAQATDATMQALVALINAGALIAA